MEEIVKAVNTGDLDKVQDLVLVLVHQGIDLKRIRDRKGWTVLHHVAKSGNVEVAEYVLERGFDVNCKVVGYCCETPLLISAKEGNMDMVKYLIEHGADINAMDSPGRSVMQKACESNSLELIEYLVGQGLDVNCRDTLLQNTPLLISCSKGNMDIVKYLLKHGADINARNMKGQDVLHKASNNQDLVDYLHKLGFEKTNMLIKATPSLGSEIRSSSITATEATVRFDAPTSRNFDSYKVRVHPSTNGEQSTLVPKDAASPFCVLSNLVPSTEYTVAIGVAKGSVDGPLKIAIFTTLPPGIDSEVSVTSITQTTATAIFDAPTLGKFDYKVSIIPSTKCEAVQSVREYSETTSTMHAELSNLVPGTVYRVAVWTVQGGAVGQQRERTFTTCSPDIGSEITVNSISATSATVSFKPPLRGCFDRYSLTIDPLQNGETAADIPNDAASPSSVLSNLVPGTEYTVAVNVVKGENDGALKSRTFITLPPDIGSEVSVTSITSTTATAIFEKPTRGKFDCYKVLIIPLSNGETSESPVNYSETTMQAELSNLVPCTIYKVAVWTVKGGAVGQKRERTFTTYVYSDFEENSEPFLGRGSFGAVYLYHHKKTNEQIAVKKLNLQQTVPSKEEEDLMVEVKIMRELSPDRHPNIVLYLFEHTCIDKDARRFCIGMEYMAGGSLKQKIYQEKGPLPADTVQNYTHQILLGVDFLHDKHIVHRDIKSENILMDMKDGIKLADFGISKKLSTYLMSRGATTAGIGTYQYMSPEAMKGQVGVADSGKPGYGTKTDIWSVGCVVLEMASGKRPWSELKNNQMALLYRVGTNGEAPPIADNVSEGVKDFLAKIFIVDPGVRPSAKELLQHEWRS